MKMIMIIIITTIVKMITIIIVVVFDNHIYIYNHIRYFVLSFTSLYDIALITSCPYI